MAIQAFQWWFSASHRGSIVSPFIVYETLQIRFVYTGKGTTGVPVRGTYGPLISAISIEYDSSPNRKWKIIIAVVVVASVFLLLFLGISWWKGYLGCRISKEEVLRGLDLHTGVFTFQQIKADTDKFSAVNKIEEGGFGPVYKVPKKIIIDYDTSLEKGLEHLDLLPVVYFYCLEEHLV
ncbi:hypothetical protein POM88_012758 [Heracleum sosnowskyi]|uniref:Uncharacterized protein n=1 Tax=Heracleum sosnowskyi TaxID=360622 RepID=A0AAD8J0I1_9APIA|nr:hypothetical protein POM88_012758 [Heracleum sosnowskyi]